MLISIWQMTFIDMLILGKICISFNDIHLFNEINWFRDVESIQSQKFLFSFTELAISLLWAVPFVPMHFFLAKKLSACTALTAKNIMRWKLAVKYNMAIEYKCGLTTLPYTELSIVPTLFFLSIFQVTVQLVSKQNLSKQNEWWQLYLFFSSSLF